jgi:hypothetical protein
MNISERQEKVLITVLERGEVGPRPWLNSWRLASARLPRPVGLEEHGLVAGDESGKRVNTPLGRDLVENIVNRLGKVDRANAQQKRFG